MSKGFWAALAALAVVGMGGSAQAAAYTFETAPYASDSQLSIGFVFTANTDLYVTALGYSDADGDGFVDAHGIAIWSGDAASAPGTLLASATLAAGASGALGDDDYRYVAITPLKLLAGQTYTIAGFSPGTSDPWRFGGPVAGGGFAPYTGFAVDPRITIGANAARYAYGTGTLAQPGQHASDYQFYAVNFTIADGVPEPATWALMLGGFGLAGTALRRRRALA